jgi:hypothetical protein
MSSIRISESEILAARRIESFKVSKQKTTEGTERETVLTITNRQARAYIARQTGRRSVGNSPVARLLISNVSPRVAAIPRTVEEREHCRARHRVRAVNKSRPVNSARAALKAAIAAYTRTPDQSPG